jgi:hypothetical protein
VIEKWGLSIWILPRKKPLHELFNPYSKLSNVCHFLLSVRLTTLSSENDWKFFINRPWGRNSIRRDLEMISMSCTFELNRPILRKIFLTGEASDYPIQEFDSVGVSELQRTRRNIHESCWFFFVTQQLSFRCNHLDYSKHMSGFVKQFCFDLWFSPLNLHHCALHNALSRVIDRSYCNFISRLSNNLVCIAISCGNITKLNHILFRI